MEDYSAGHTVGKFCSKEGEERKLKGGRRERVEKTKTKTKNQLAGLEDGGWVRCGPLDEGLEEMVRSFQSKL